MKLYLPTLIWAGLTLLIAIQAWWASFEMHMRANWSFLGLLVVMLHSISLYMIAALVLPNVTGETVVDLREHYFMHRRWFFAAVLSSTIFSLGKSLALSGHLMGGSNLLFHIIFAVAGIAALLTAQECFHRLLAPVVSCIFIVYIAMLYARL